MSWNELKQKPELLEGTDAVVNLAGETLNQRWTDKSKQRILQSRLLSVARLAQALNALQKKPEVIIQASAVAAYGTSLTETFDEKVRAVRKIFCLRWLSNGRKLPMPTLPMSV